ncbi:DUF2341 domain-containing protein [Candidatus Woesearchaeota archaeon]|nr:DUF2341 domain-containing protein [Candidatus Woesearchaeota archaeon]
MNKIILYVLISMLLVSCVLGASKHDFVELVENTDFCFDCYTIYKITKAADVSLDKFEVDFKDVSGSSVSKDFQVSYLVTESYVEYVDDYESCVKNWTVIDNETQEEEVILYDAQCFVGTEEVQKKKEYYSSVSLSNLKKFFNSADVGKEYYVKVSGELKQGESVDNILTFNDFVYDEYAWWNNSWSYRQDVSINNSYGNLTNHPVRIGLNSSLVGANFNWSNSGVDLRFTNSTESELDFWIQDWNSTVNTTVVWVNMTDCPHGVFNVSMYYGSPSVSGVSNASKVFGYDAGFEAKTGWTEVDPNSKIELNTSSQRLEFNALGGSTAAWVYHAFSGGGYKNFILDFTLYANPQNKAWHVVALAEPVGDSDNDFINSSHMMFGKTVGGTAKMYVYNKNGSASSQTSFDYDFASRVQYCRLIKNGSGTTLDVWENSDRVGTANVSIGQSGNYHDNYLSYLMAITNQGVNAESLTGWADDYLLRNYTFPEPALISVGSEETLPEVIANESYGREAIIAGADASAVSGSYAAYSDKQVYIRLMNGSQYKGTFDKYITYSSGGTYRRWAFNYDNESSSSFPSFFNITPVFYVWQKYNMTYNQIKWNVSDYVNNTD